MNARSNRITRTACVIFTLTTLLTVISGVGAQGALPLPLPQGTEAQSKPLFTADHQRQTAPAPLYRGVIRSRAVNIDPAAISATDVEVASRGSSSPLALNLFDGLNVTALNTSIEFRQNAAGYIWTGMLAEDPHSTVVLVFDGDQLTGEISFSGGSYLIRSDAGGQHHIIEIAPEQMIETGGTDAIPMPNHPVSTTAVNGELSVPASMPAANEPLALPGRDAGTTLDLMVMYTPTAASFLGGDGSARSVIDSLVAFTNKAYADSGITHRVRLVHSQKIAYNEQGILNDLYALSGKEDGYMNEVHALRDMYQADIVSLISFNSSCGLGFLMTEMRSYSDEYAFNVVDASCSAGRTLAHEIGHNLGAQHDVDNTEISGIAPYAYGYQDGTFATIMAYGIKGVCAKGCPRIPYFANPQRQYNGRPLGSASADIARVFSQTAPFAATFRAGTVTPIGFSLVAPVHQAVLTSRESAFTWQPQPSADQYTLKITSEDGRYKYKVKLTAGQVCNANQCSFSPAGDAKWTPRANTSHRWFVKARVGGVAIKSSEKWSFMNNFLPETIRVTSPASNQTLNTTSVGFQWQADARLTSYMLKIKDASGTKISKQKFTAAQICAATADTCTVNLGLDAGVANGSYSWQLIGQRDGVIGKVKAKSTVQIHR